MTATLKQDNFIATGGQEKKTEVGDKWYIYQLTCIASIGGFLFGYDTGVISGALLLLKTDKRFDLTNIQMELIVSITVGAAFIFALVGGWLNKYVGRRKANIISSIFFALGSIILGLSNDFYHLLIGRGIVGVGLGIASMSVPIYLSECSPASRRGAIVTINNLSVTGGQMVSAFACAFLSTVDNGWRWMLGLAAVPATMQFIGFIFILPESPRYLIEIDQKPAAHAVLQRIRGEEDIEKEIKVMEDRIKESANEKSVDLLKTRNGRHALVVGSMLQFLQQFTGINTVMYYSATIIYMSGLVTDTSAAIWFSTLTASMNFLFTFVGLWTIESLGRRKLILMSIAGCTISLLILSGGFQWTHQLEERVNFNRTISNCSQQFDVPCSDCLRNECAFCFSDGKGSCDNENVKNAEYTCRDQNISSTVFWSDTFCPKTDVSWIPIFGMMLYLATFAPGMGPVPWTVNAEIYPQPCREMGMAASTGVNWLSNFVVSLTFLSLLEALGTSSAFLLYASFGVVGFILIYMLLPETQGVSLDKMDAVLERGWIQVKCVQFNSNSKSYKLPDREETVN